MEELDWLKQYGLSLYVSQAGTAHVIKTFPDTDNFYIFCNRHFGPGSGTILPASQLDSKRFYELATCDKCFVAILTAVERVRALSGVTPNIGPLGEE